MSIRRYKPEADTTITNAYEADLTTRATGSNMGESDVLEVFNIYGQASSTSNEQSRILIKFPTTGIVSDRDTTKVIPASGSVNFYLKLYNVPHGETLPTNFSLEVSPLTKTWDEGHGLDMEEYSDMGVSGNGNTFGGTGASWTSPSSGVNWTAAGGDSTTPTVTASFEEGDEDLDIDITAIVESWIATPASNHGLIVKLTSAVEGGTESFYTKKFSARNSEYFFNRPTIEARWDSSEKDDRNNFYAKSNLRSDNNNVFSIKNYVDGALTNIPGVGSTDMAIKFYTSLGPIPAQSSITVNSGVFVDGDVVTLTDYLGTTKKFEFQSGANLQSGGDIEVCIGGTCGPTLSTLAEHLTKLAEVVNATSNLKIAAEATGTVITFIQGLGGTVGNNNTPTLANPYSPSSLVINTTIATFAGGSANATGSGEITPDSVSVDNSTTGVYKATAAITTELPEIYAEWLATTYTNKFEDDFATTTDGTLPDDWEFYESGDGFLAGAGDGNGMFGATGVIYGHDQVDLGSYPANNGWAISSAALKAWGANGSQNTAILKSYSFDDFILEVDINPLDDDRVDIIARHTGDIAADPLVGEYYRLSFTAGQGTADYQTTALIVVHHPTTAAPTVTNVFSYQGSTHGFTKGTSFKLKFEFIENTYSVYIDDELKYSGTDSTITSAGMIGLQERSMSDPADLGGAGGVFFDDFKVSDPGVTQSFHTETIEVKQRSVAAANIPEYVTTIQNLKKVYSNDEMARFRLFIRSKDWSPTIYTVATTELKSEVVEDAYYKIMRVVDDFTVIDYGSGTIPYTKLSYDENGPYFDFDMSMLETGWAYRIELMYKINGEMRQQPEAFKFRVVE